MTVDDIGLAPIDVDGKQSGGSAGTWVLDHQSPRRPHDRTGVAWAFGRCRAGDPSRGCGHEGQHHDRQMALERGAGGARTRRSWTDSAWRDSRSRTSRARTQGRRSAACKGHRGWLGLRGTRVWTGRADPFDWRRSALLVWPFQARFRRAAVPQSSEAFSSAPSFLPGAEGRPACFGRQQSSSSCPSPGASPWRPSPTVRRSTR